MKKLFLSLVLSSFAFIACLSSFLTFAGEDNDEFVKSDIEAQTSREYGLGDGFYDEYKYTNIGGTESGNYTHHYVVSFPNNFGYSYEELVEEGYVSVIIWLTFDIYSTSNGTHTLYIKRSHTSFNSFDPIQISITNKNTCYRYAYKISTPVSKIDDLMRMYFTANNGTTFNVCHFTASCVGYYTEIVYGEQLSSCVQINANH